MNSNNERMMAELTISYKIKPLTLVLFCLTEKPMGLAITETRHYVNKNTTILDKTVLLYSSRPSIKKKERVPKTSKQLDINYNI